MFFQIRDCGRGSEIFYWSFSSNHNLTIKATKPRNTAALLIHINNSTKNNSVRTLSMFLLKGDESCVKIDYNKRPEMLLIC